MTKDYQVIWTNTAESDLESIIEYIAKDSVLNAQNVLSRIKKEVAILFTFPSQGRIVSELKEFNIRQYREIIVNPWRVIYKIVENKIYIESVIDSRRNVEDLLLHRLISK